MGNLGTLATSLPRPLYIFFFAEVYDLRFPRIASALLVTIRPPFSLEITLDATANSEQSRIFRYRTDQGWSDQLAQYFQGVLLAAQTTIDLSLSALIESDKEAIDAYRADPVRLLQLTISRAKSG
jgi:hypothetical protein